MVLVWSIIGGTLLVGLAILIVIIIVVVEIKRFSDGRSRGPPYTTIAELEGMYDAN